MKRNETKEKNERKRKGEKKEKNEKNLKWSSSSIMGIEMYQVHSFMKQRTAKTDLSIVPFPSIVPQRAREVVSTIGAAGYNPHFGDLTRPCAPRCAYINHFPG